MTIDIPNKSSFKINEVCALTDVKSYVLRYWESEFPEISPVMSAAGQKLYSHRDLETILYIKKLLFDVKLSIEKAKAEVKLMYPSVDLISDDFQSDAKEDHVVEVSKHKSQLSEFDQQKLLLAKLELQKVLTMTQNLKCLH